jgi:MerR family transcriptional regulator, light-induced transcriptional regulator
MVEATGTGNQEGPMETPALRIGAVARRTGVAVATLRAWESRYGVLRPSRTEGGHRLYSEEDVDRVLAVLRLTSQGWTVSAAAASVTAERSPSRLGLVRTSPSEPDETDGSARRIDAATMSLRDALTRAIRGFDASAAEEVLDTSLARLGVAFALEDVVMPVLRDLGVGWEDDPSLIASEHFATNTLRPRLHRMLMGARSPSAPTCIAAAPEPEDHELGVLAAAAIAADLGFRVTYLGSRTPTVALERSIATLRPDVVLIGAMTAHAGRHLCAEPPALGDARLIVGGAGFDGLEAALPDGTLQAGALTELRRILQRALERGGATG